MGTLPPEGMGSLLDCGTVHRGKTAWHQNNQQIIFLGPTSILTFDEQQSMSNAYSYMPRSMLKIMKGDQRYNTTLVLTKTYPCRGYRLFSPPSQHMCLGSLRCILETICDSRNAAHMAARKHVIPSNIASVTSAIMKSAMVMG